MQTKKCRIRYLDKDEYRSVFSQICIGFLSYITNPFADQKHKVWRTQALEEVPKEMDRNYRFWQRDALAIRMDGQAKVEQKLEYIHLNPLQEHWNLVSKPENYYWSSAKYYEEGIDDFGFITHYKERF
jgi:hypothetical protein